MEELLHSGIHWNLINFAIFVWLLYFFLKKPLKEFWESRAGEIRFDIEEAERLGGEVKARYEEMRRKVSRLDDEARKLTDSLEREGEMEKKQLMEEGGRRADRLREDGGRILEQESRKARESLKEQTASLALETAEKMIRDHIRPEDQKRLSEEYMSGLEGRAA